MLMSCHMVTRDPAHPAACAPKRTTTTAVPRQRESRPSQASLLLPPVLLPLPLPLPLPPLRLRIRSPPPMAPSRHSLRSKKRRRRHRRLLLSSVRVAKRARLRRIKCLTPAKAGSKPVFVGVMEGLCLPTPESVGKSGWLYMQSESTLVRVYHHFPSLIIKMKHSFFL